MFYDVLVNYSQPWAETSNWRRLSTVRGFNRVLYLFKYEIKSKFDFVYVRQIRTSKCGLCTGFKLINSSSYTFAHYPKIPDSKNLYLVQKFDSLADSYGEVFNEN